MDNDQGGVGSILAEDVGWFLLLPSSSASGM